MTEMAPLSQSRINQYSRLLSSVFKKSFFNDEYLNWQYFQNPNGDAVGYDIIHGNDVVAHYACIPLELGISRKRVLLSLNTATRQEFQGKGFFTQLARRTFEDATFSFDCVIGVANENSVHGFTRKLGFQHIGNLNLRYGTLANNTVGTNRIYYSSQALAWRLKSQRGKYRLIRSDSTFYVWKKLSILGPSLWQPVLSLESEFQDPDFSDGKRPKNSWALDWWPQNKDKNLFSLPGSLKPSPLHLIKLDLSAAMTHIDYFSFLDFDAY